MYCRVQLETYAEELPDSSRPKDFWAPLTVYLLNNPDLQESKASTALSQDSWMSLTYDHYFLALLLLWNSWMLRLCYLCGNDSVLPESERGVLFIFLCSLYNIVRTILLLYTVVVGFSCIATKTACHMMYGEICQSCLCWFTCTPCKLSNKYLKKKPGRQHLGPFPVLFTSTLILVCFCPSNCAVSYNV